MDAVVRISHKHAHHHVDESLWNLVSFEELFRVRMILEEVCVSRLHCQIVEVNVSFDCGSEWWSSKSQDEEKNTQGEHVCGLGPTRYRRILMDFWSHVNRCT